MSVNLRINSKNRCWLLKFTLIWDEGLQTICKGSPDEQPCAINIYHHHHHHHHHYYYYYCYYSQKFTFLDNRSSYLFIFNPCIGLQLICLCGNFYFLLSVSLRLFLFCHLTLFLPIFPFYVPLKMPESLWFFGVSRWSGMKSFVIFGSIYDDLIQLVMFPVYTPWRHRRACGSLLFWGIWK